MVEQGLGVSRLPIGVVLRDGWVGEALERRGGKLATALFAKHSLALMSATVFIGTRQIWMGVRLDIKFGGWLLFSGLIR